MLRKALLVSLFSLTFAVAANACVDCHWSYAGDGYYTIDCTSPGQADHCEGTMDFGGSTTCSGVGDCGGGCFDYTNPIPDCGRGPDQQYAVLNAPRAVVAQGSLHHDFARSAAAEPSR